MRLSRVTAFLLAALVSPITALLGGCGQEPGKPPLQRIRERGTLIVAHEAAFEPFEYRDAKTGEVVGFDIDLARELAKDLGVTVEFRNVKFADIDAELGTRRADLIISGLTVTPPRQRVYAFSKPYFHTVTALLVSKAKAADVRSVKDLDRAGRVVAVQSGTTGVEAARKTCAKAEIRQFATDNDAVMDVVQGRCDAFLFDLATLRSHHERNPDTTILLPEPITSEPYAVAARKDEPELAAWVDGVLDKMRADGRLKGIHEKHKPDGTLDEPK